MKRPLTCNGGASHASGIQFIASALVYPIGLDQLEWRERVLRVSIALGRRFLDGDLSVHLELFRNEDIKVSEVELDAPDDALDGAGKYFKNRLNLDRLYGRLNNFRLPSEGLPDSGRASCRWRWLSSSTDYLDLNGKADVLCRFISRTLVVAFIFMPVS